MFILISNEPMKVADLQKLANQLMLNGALVIDLPVKARKTLPLDIARNIVIKPKIEIFHYKSKFFRSAKKQPSCKL